MNDIPKEKMDEILSKLALLLGADNVLVVFGGPNHGLRMAMRKDMLLDTDALRQNAISIINESFQNIIKSEQDQSRNEQASN